MTPSRYLNLLHCTACQAAYGQPKFCLDGETAVCEDCLKQHYPKLFARWKKRRYDERLPGSLPGHGAETPGGTPRKVPPSADAPKQMNTTEEPPILAGLTAPQAELETQHEKVYTGITPDHIPCPGAFTPPATSRATRQDHPARHPLPL